MKHKWGEIDDIRYGGRYRICLFCRKKQTWTSHQKWMRVVGYSWYPKVGRCQGKDVFDNANLQEDILNDQKTPKTI